MKLIVPYRGQTTIRELVAQYESAHADINDANFPTRENGDVELEVDLYELPTTMHTDEILQKLSESELRGLTVAETLAFGVHHTNGPLVSFAEPFRKRLMLHVVIATGRTAQLGGFKSNWLRRLRVPVTRKIR